MQRHFSLRILSLALLLAGVLSACAHMVMPTGGEKDTAGPKLLRVKPDNKSTKVAPDEVVFYFDEYLKPGSYSKEVFVSPYMKAAPDVTVVNRKLIIKFNEDLRNKTTYVINIGKAIKDYNEGNDMAEPIVYAFSTGGNLDTLGFAGRVTHAWSGNGLPGVTVMLYPAADADSNRIFDKAPTYIASTDDNGNFRFQYISAGDYRVYAVKDADQSFTWNQKKESIGLARMPDVHLGVDSANKAIKVKPVMLMLFQPDADKPAVKAAKWLNEETILVSFKEPLPVELLVKNLTISVSDTGGYNASEIKGFQFVKGKQDEILVRTGTPRTRLIQLNFLNLTDSLGTPGDTFCRVPAVSSRPAVKPQPFDKPRVEPSEGQVFLQSFYALASQPDDSLIQLTDTSGNRIAANVRIDRHELRVIPTSVPKAGQPLKLVLRKGLPFLSGAALDSTWTFSLSWPDPAQFGSLSGTIATDSLKPGEKWVWQFVKMAGKESKVIARFDGKNEFQFRWLEPGKYKFFLVRDADGNGCFTPGSLEPYRLPEEVWTDEKEIEIKAKWDMENYQVKPVKAQGGAGTGGSRGSRGGAAGEEKPEQPEDQPVDGTEAPNPENETEPVSPE